MRPIGGATREAPLPPRSPPPPPPPLTPPPAPLFGIPVLPPPPPPMPLPLVGDKRAERPISVVAGGGGGAAAAAAAVAAAAVVAEEAAPPDAKWLLLVAVALEARERREPGVESRVELVSDLARWRSSSPKELLPPAMPMPMPRLLFGEIERLAQESLLSRSESLSFLPCYSSVKFSVFK